MRIYSRENMGLRFLQVYRGVFVETESHMSRIKPSCIRKRGFHVLLGEARKVATVTVAIRKLQSNQNS